jgi:hypothetical protein
MRLQVTWCFVACVMLLAAVVTSGAGAADSTGTAYPPAHEIADAGMRGARWLVENKDAIPPRVALTTFRKIYRVTADDVLAAELLEIIRETEDTLPQANIAIDINDPSARRWHSLRPALTELVRFKCVNQLQETDLQPVEDLRDFYWDQMFLSTMDLSKKVVAAYLLRRLGVADDLYDSVVEEIRSRADLLDQPRSYSYVFYLYALTHIVLTSSGYYDHYLDPAEFRGEIAGFSKALKDFETVEDLTATELDVASEILICLKLLGMPADHEAEEIYRRLVDIQNADGSWGSGAEVTGAKIHNTAVAAIALIDFAPEFREGDIYCDSITYPAGRPTRQE